MKLTTFDTKKHKVVLCGEMIGDTLFRKVRPEHFMRVVGGYGIQEVAFQKIVLKGIDKIVLKEEGTEVAWESKVKDWLHHSKIADYGHGKQRFLSLKYMKAHMKPKPLEEIIIKREQEQLSLLK